MFKKSIPVSGRYRRARNQWFRSPRCLSVARWWLSAHNQSPLAKFVEVVVAGMEIQIDKSTTV